MKEATHTPAGRRMTGMKTFVLVVGATLAIMASFVLFDSPLWVFM